MMNLSCVWVLLKVAYCLCESKTMIVAMGNIRISD